MCGIGESGYISMCVSLSKIHELPDLQQAGFFYFSNKGLQKSSTDHEAATTTETIANNLDTNLQYDPLRV